MLYSLLGINYGNQFFIDIKNHQLLIYPYCKQIFRVQSLQQFLNLYQIFNFFYLIPKMNENQDIFQFDVDVFEPLEPINSSIRQEPAISPIIQPKPSYQPQQSISLSNQSILQPYQQQGKQKQRKVFNRFSLTDEQKINLTKRLPRGFVLLKKGDFPPENGPFKGEIQYIPVKRGPKIASEQLLEKFPIAVLSSMYPKKQIQKRVQKPGLRLSTGQLPQGKSKQTQKVKGVLQKFRKHPRYPQLAQQLNKLGLMQGFSQIQGQIKKNIHTIDSFKDRCLYILNSAKSATFAQTTIDVINELIQQLMFQIEQAKKLEFENNLQSIQKNIDKITRQITDIRESGNWYLRKKKRSQKNFQEKEVMYIADLVRNLAPAYLVGVWEIVEEKPFLESQEKQIQINFSQLKTKKIRQIQSYVKRKHNTYITSRERKREKISRKQEEEVEKRLNSKEGIKKEQEKNEDQDKLKVEDVMKNQTIEMENEDLESFMNVVDVTSNNKDQTKRQMFQQQEKPVRSKSDNVDFLQLDELFLSDQKLNTKPNQEFKVPPTPRFSSLDNNPHEDERIKAMRKDGQGQAIDQEKEIKEFEMEQPNLRMPQVLDGDSSDSSFITDDEDSDY